MGCIVPNCNLDRGMVQEVHKMVRECVFCVCCLERKPIPKRCRITGNVSYM